MFWYIDDLRLPHSPGGGLVERAMHDRVALLDAAIQPVRAKAVSP
ncbi:hypothetical protein [Pseudomonas citronellolis]|nr:hypothetical protein [Pseudomonas citronellolis]MDF3934764.1 hypothetical protein [Pseudomonas citronellolis]